MWNWCRLARVGLFAGATLTLSLAAVAQSGPTAQQPLHLSAFGAGTGTYTGLYGGHNAGITAGGDLTFTNFRGVRPSIEVRGTYPFWKGQIVGERDILGGVKLEGTYVQRFHPYVDFLIGIGAMNYPNGIAVGNFVYLRTSSTVYSPGVGVDVDLTPRWAVKADVQYQRWRTPVRPYQESVWSTPVSFGATYRFDFNPHHHFPKRHGGGL